MTTLIKNGRIVTGETVFQGDLLVKNGRIAEIATQIAKVTAEVVDAAGKYVIPGAVDPSVHLARDVFGTTTCEDFETGTRSALFGGTTTVVGHAFPQKGACRKGLEEWVRKAEGKAYTDYAFHMDLTNFNDRMLAEIPVMVREGVSSFICHYTSRSLALNDGQMFRIFRAAAEQGALVGIHAGSGDLTLTLEKEMQKEDLPPALAHAKCRPPQAEGFATNTALALAEMAEAPVYLLHLSSAHALEKVKIFRDRGNAVYAETCPHYLVLGSDRLEGEDFLPARFVCSPPLRDAWHHECLWRGIVSGDLQSVSSDHMPFRYDTQKSLGKKDMRKIPSGLPGVEYRILLLHHFGVAEGRISMPRLVQLVSTNPSRLLGLHPRKGAIALGADADLVILNPDATTTITDDSHHGATDYSPYAGMVLQGAIERVLKAGRTVVRDGQLLVDAGTGSFLSRGLSDRI